MRIESYSQIQSLYQTSRVSNTPKAKTAPVGIDRVSISSIGKDMKTAKDALKASPDVRGTHASLRFCPWHPHCFGGQLRGR